MVGDAARYLYTSIERLPGSNHDDVLIYDNGRNVLRGKCGVDRIYGGGSNDFIGGGSGLDYVLFGDNKTDYQMSISAVPCRSLICPVGVREQTAPLT